MAKRRGSLFAPALFALLALSCGRSLTLDATPTADGGGGGGSGGGGGAPTSTTNDAGDALTIGGAGGTLVNPGIDAGSDRGMAATDASDGAIDTRPPDATVDHTQTPDTGVIGCPANCAQLPHVLAGAYVPCVNGVCSIGYGSCEAGFAHCSGTNVGCETDLSTTSNCGSCGGTCYGNYLCQPYYGGYFCTQPCQSPTPDSCQLSCVDEQSDTSNCGSCGNSCYVPNTQVACLHGQCATMGCIDSTFADCTSDPGCETPLGNDSNCGGCNDPVCTLANTMYTCSDGQNCDAAVCLPGYANCTTASADCETPFTSATPPAGCLPQYVGSVGLATQALNTTATSVAADGSFFIAGTYEGSVDFDPSSAGKDVRTATDSDGYVTKFNADGSYAWTAALTGRGSLTMTAIAVTPAGGVVATGYYQDSIDLDPGPAADIHLTSDTFANDTFVVELSASGAEAWGRTFQGISFEANGSSTGIAVDGAGAVAVAGYFTGTVDFDPGAGTDARTATGSGNNGFLVKLTSAGDLAWASIVDDADCTSTLLGVAVATDGSVWSTGTVAAGPACQLGPERTADPMDDVFIMKVSAAGDTRTTWSLGEVQADSGTAVAAGRDGSVYIAGTGSGSVDLDPGPSVARRWLGSTYSSGGFVIKLAADGTLVWARVLAASRIDAMAATADGGVVATGFFDQWFVTRFTAAGASAWTFSIGDSAVMLTSVSSSGTTFAVGGVSSGTQDLDPSTAIDLIFGDVAFVSRFTY